MEPLALPLSALGYIAPKLKKELEKREVATVGDLLYLHPRAYEDRRRSLSLAEWPSGERGFGIANIEHVATVRLGARNVLKVLLGDGTAHAEATFFNARPWMAKLMPVGERVAVSGELRRFGAKRELVHPEIEPLREGERDKANYGRVVPLYTGFEGAQQRALRALIYRALELYARTLVDPLPVALRERRALPSLGEALVRLHFPKRDSEEWRAERTGAQRRLAFDELLLMQLGFALKRSKVKGAPGIAFDFDDERLARLLRLLPFAPTGAQARVLREVAADMRSSEPMNRLLQGDVGAGKTAVAAVAAAAAMENGLQVALMAPTEILASQHYASLSRWLAPLGMEVLLLTAAGSKSAKSAVRRRVADGSARLVVGTHALVQESVAFAELGLVIIDEQHRFGVLQRAELSSKGRRPDVLVMTATPIPRTLQMAACGELDLSTLDELPPGRKPVKTHVVEPARRARALERLGEELSQGRQGYVVFPLVEESEKSDLRSAQEGAAELAARFAPLRVGLLHGRLKGEEKAEIIASFRRGELSLLVATTVVEVGVDVPSATIMMIESAERFGLSQLHQLRGRVGRGEAESLCLLMVGQEAGAVARERLATLAATNDGFKVAEADLRLRGPGELLGTRQSGLPPLGAADLVRDQDLMVVAKEEARLLLGEAPGLLGESAAPLRQALERRWAERLALAEIG